MTTPIFVDNVYGTIASGITAAATSITLTTGHGARFPAVTAGFILYATMVNSSNVVEEIHITAHTASSDTLTVTRAANSTTAKVWNAGDRIECRLTSEHMTALVTGPVSYSDTTESTSISTGSIITAGGLGVAKNAWVGGTLNVAGAVTLQSTLGVAGAAAAGAGSVIGGAGGGGSQLAVRSNQNTAWGLEISTSADLGGGFFAAFVNASNVKQGGISATNSTTTAFATSSDKTKKTDMGLATDVSGLLATEVHDFEWMENGVIDRGVFAQDAIKVLARPIIRNEKENWWGADYSKYVPDLIVLGQNHEARLKALDVRLKALDVRLKALEAK